MQLRALQSLALSVAAARSPGEVLKLVVQGLGMTEGVALARVWLLDKRADGEPFLQLAASIGASTVDPDRRWNRVDGEHAALPLSYGKVGSIARTNQPLLLQRGPGPWLMDPEWAEREGILSFAGQPVTFKSEVLGVLAFFSCSRLEKHDLDWLRVFADHAAVAVATARAFEEIERLKESAERERDYLRAVVRRAHGDGTLLAESPKMLEVLEQVRAVAQSDSAVLVLGESGVGKELVASAVHDLSPRRDGPLVKVNCASVPQELFESEFFGHVRGAFSGAARDRQGRFLLADGGTLFLDEVGEIPLAMQGKLLRILQEQTFEAVGDDRTRRVNVRVIAATNRPLEADVEAGRFRRDLYYRLSVLPLEVPPLRERRKDILPMARRFIQVASERMGLPSRELSAEDERALLAYDYPGNVRELQNIVERWVVLRESGRLLLELGAPLPAEAGAARGGGGPAEGTERVLTAKEVREFEKRNLERALAKTGYQIAGPSGAAKLLGLSPSTLAYRIKQLGVRRPE